MPIKKLAKTLKKFNRSRKKRRKVAEGFGPVYEKGKIVPGFEGLGPKYEKDLGPMKKMPRTPKEKKKAPKNNGYFEPRRPGKRYFV